MKHTKERADDRKLLVRAIHEAGHAVFMWRGGEALYGDNWCDRIAPFEAIILSPYVGDCVPPLVFRGQQRRDVTGCVFTHEISSLHHLNVPIKGGTTRERRAVQQWRKLKAWSEIIGGLAGPIAEEHHIAQRDGYEPYFDWQNELDTAEIYGLIETDTTRAFALARALWRSPLRQALCLEDAVAEIEAKLTGDPRYWRTIEALADVLLARKTYRVGHDAAVHIMRKVWRRSPAGTILEQTANEPGDTITPELHIGPPWAALPSREAE